MSPASRLASYFCLFSKHARFSDPGTVQLPRKIVPEARGQQILTPEVASALAFICVENPGNEVYTVGIQVSDTSAGVYVAENMDISPALALTLPTSWTN